MWIKINWKHVWPNLRIHVYVIRYVSQLPPSSVAGLGFPYSRHVCRSLAHRELQSTIAVDESSPVCKAAHAELAEPFHSPRLVCSHFAFTFSETHKLCFVEGIVQYSTLGQFNVLGINLVNSFSCVFFFRVSQNRVRKKKQNETKQKWTKNETLST